MGRKTTQIVGNDNGVITKSHYDIDEDRLVITHEMADVQPLLDKNAQQRNNFRGYKGDMHKVATIDPVTVTKLMNAGIWGDKERMKRWLNDPENRYFRTSTGKV